MEDTLGEDNLEQIFMKHIERDEKDHELLIMMNGKLDGLVAGLAGIPALEIRVRAVEQIQTAHGVAIDTIAKEVEKLRNTSNLWSTFNTLVAGVATAIAIFMGIK